MSIILITGGAGFIGSHTADALVASGYGVRILDKLDPQIHGDRRQFPSYLNPQIECIRGDVRSPDDVKAALEGVNAVYHFAALTGVGQSMYDQRDYVDNNCTGTATLLEAIVKSGIRLRRFILASSRAVYGEGTHDCPHCGTVYPGTRKREDLRDGKFGVYCSNCRSLAGDAPTREERPLLPISIYGWTKKHQEELCWQAAQSFGIPTVALRYFNVYGSRQSLKNPYTGVVSIFFSRLAAGERISLYERGEPTRDFVHIRDVVKANVLALTSNISPGRCINVGVGKKVTITDVANALGDACGVRPQLYDGGEFRIGDIRSCYADITHARGDLGYYPTVSLQEGMREFVSWARTEECRDMYDRSVKELESHGLFDRVRTPS